MKKPHKHRDVIVAWADGEQIEYYDESALAWITIDSENNIPNFLRTDIKFRVNDRYRELKDAHSAGKTIQLFTQVAPETGDWVDDLNPTWEYSHSAYRIKPKLVPFTWEDRDKVRARWVKYICEDTKLEAWIDSVQKSGVTVAGNFYSYDDLLAVYKFTDGSPCGKYIDE